MIDYDTIRIVSDVNFDLALRKTEPTDSYILRSADGITAPEFNMQIKNTLYQGGVFQNRQPLNRQVVLNVKLNPNYGAGETVKSLRQKLYKMLSPRWSNAIKVQLMLAGSVIAEVEGHVSGMPMNPFAKEPEVQVTIDCLSAYLFSPTPVNYLPPSSVGWDIDYAGSAPIGFQMELQLTVSPSYFEIFHVDNIFEKIRITYPFAANDIITIDTRPGLRSVMLTRGGITSSILSGYSNDSKWIQIYEGVNEFDTSTKAFNWMGIVYTPQWWGA